MTTKFEDIYDWTTVPIGESIIATAVRDDHHTNVFSDLAQVWAANAGMIDVGLYTFERRSVALTYTLGTQAPVSFSGSGQRVTNTLVEKAMLKMPIAPAVGMAEAILEAAKRSDPAAVAGVLARLGKA